MSEAEVTEPTEPKPARKRRFGCLARLGCAGALAAVGLGAVILGGGVYLFSDSGQRMVRDQVRDLVGGAMNEGSFELGDLTYGLDGRIHLEGAAVLDADGREVAVVDVADAQINWWALLRGEVHLTSLDVTGVRGDLLVDEEGQLDLARLFAAEPDPEAAPFEGLPVDLRFDDISVREGAVAVRGIEPPVGVEDLSIDGRFLASGLRFEVGDLKVRGRFTDPRDGPLALDGLFVWDTAGIDDTDLHVTALNQRGSVKGSARDLGGDAEAVDLTLDLEQLDLDDLDALTTAGLDGRFQGGVKATGTLADLQLDGTLTGRDGTDGSLSVDGSVNAVQPAWKGTVTTDGLRVDQLLDGMSDAFPVTTTLQVEGAGSTWPDGVGMTGRISDTELEIVGITLDKAAATLALNDGVIALSDIDAQGRAGRVTGSGTVDLQRSIVALDLRGEQLDPRHLRSVSVPAELDGTRGSTDVHVEVAYGEPEVTVDVTGTMVAAPLLWTSDIRADRATGSFVVRVRGTDVDVDCDVRTTGLNTYGYVSDEARSDGVEIRVRDTGVKGKGDLVLGPGRYTFIPEGFIEELGHGVELDGGTGGWTMEQGFAEGSPLMVDAVVDLGAHKLMRYPGQSGRVSVAMVDNIVGLTAKMDATASRRLVDAQGTMNLDDLSFSFDQLQVAPEPGQTWTARPGAAFRVEGLGVADLDMDLRSARGHLGLTGDVGLEGPQDLHVDVYDLDLVAIAELLPMWAEGIEGYVGGVVDVDGTAESPVVTGSFEGADIGYSYEVEGETITLITGLGTRFSLNAQNRRSRVTGRVGVDGTPLADLDLDLPFDTAFAAPTWVMDAPVDATITLLPGDLRRFEEISGVRVPTTGQVRGSLTLGGTLASPSLALDGRADMTVPGVAEELRLVTAIRRDATDVVTWDARAGGVEVEYVSTAGSAATRLDQALRWGLEGGPTPDFSNPGFWLGEVDAEARLQRLPVAPLVGVVGLPIDVSGELGGLVEVSGSAMQPQVKGKLNLVDGRAAQVLFENTSLALESDDRGYNIGLNADIIDPGQRRNQASLGTLFVAGHVPLVPDFTRDVADWVTGDLAVRVDADLPLALAAAYDAGVRQARGLVEIDGVVGGSPLDPKPHLTLFVDDDARFAYRPVGVLFSDLEASVTFDETAVRVDRLAAMTSPATTTGQLFDVFGSAVGSVEGTTRRVRKAQARAAAEEKAREQAAGRGRLLASGTASLEEWVVDELDLRLTLDRALFLRDADQNLRLSTQRPLTVTGDVFLPVVQGGVRVDTANIFVNYETLAGGGATSLDPRISVVRQGQVQAVSERETSVFDNVSIDLDVDLGNSANGRIIMPLETAQAFGSALTAALRVDVQARMQGNLEFVQNPCSRRDSDGELVPTGAAREDCGLFNPEVVGVVDISEGEAKVFQSDFVLAGSSVSFVGNEVYNPNLDINGEMDAEGLKIDMTIGGTAYDPQIEFDSDDTDQELLAVITGRDPDNLASSSANQLLNLVATAALGSALSGVNLPVISIDAKGQVEIGLSLTRQLYVEATLGGTPRPDENVIEVELEYALWEGLLIRAGTGAYAVPFWADVLFERGFD